MEQLCRVPLVECLNCRTTLRYENSNEMNEDSFPDSEFKFVHEVDNKHEKHIEPKGLEPFGEDVLQVVLSVG